MRKSSRQDVIAALRQSLLEWAGDEHSICWVAARRGAFCRGFGRWTHRELTELYPQIARSRPGISREELEEFADRWHLARQFVLDLPLACDAQQTEVKCRACGGWEEFSDEDLVRFHSEFCGEPVEIAPEREPGGE